MSFRAAAANALWDESGEIDTGEMATLAILYSSLTRALSSAVRALSGKSDVAKYYRDEVRTLLVQICDDILRVQNLYEMAFGGTGFLLRYRDLIELARTDLERLVTSRALDGAAKSVIVDVLATWARAAVHHGDTFAALAEADVPPTEDMVTTLAKYARGFIPVVASATKALDAAEGARVLLWNFLRDRALLEKLLETRLPNYVIVDRRVKLLLADCTAATEAARAIAATGTQLTEWLHSQRTWLQNASDVLSTNRFETPDAASFDEMSALKRRANNILTLYATLARSLGVTKTAHLGAVWQ
jgi:hypothetical protein